MAGLLSISSQQGLLCGLASAGGSCCAIVCRCVPGITDSVEEGVCVIDCPLRERLVMVLFLSPDSTAGCSIQCILGQPSPSHAKPSVYVDKYWHIQGDKRGCLYLWDLRSILSRTPLCQTGDKSLSPLAHDSSCALVDSWEPPALPCGLTDTLVSPPLPPSPRHH